MSEVVAVAPSNIALLKYWGRDEESSKWPSNDSFSMTLKGAETRCQAWLTEDDDHQLVLNGQQRGRLEEKKIFEFLDFLLDQMSCPNGHRVAVTTENSFPTGCGMASSASGFAALTLAVAKAVWGLDTAKAMLVDPDGRQLLSQWSRIGSGSATRSMWGGFVRWQRGVDPKSQLVESLFDNRHWELWDTVVIFSSEPKKISSSHAHQLAKTSPLFPARIAGLQSRMDQMVDAVSRKDLKSLGPLLEAECLEMHAVMMSSEPPVFYFDEKVGHFLAWLRQWRNETGVHAYFTMDAGPNVHILCEGEDLASLHKSLREKIPGVSLFVDRVGAGPRFEIH